MKPLTKSEIMKLFPKKIQRNLKVSHEFDQIDWDNLDFFGWVHPSGHIGYVIYEHEEGIKGYVLEKGRPGKTNNLKI